MAYGTVKVDNIVFTNSGVDQTITVSGIVSSISGNITATGTISGNVIQGGTLVSGATVTGTTANFTSGVFQNISGGTHTITSGVFASGAAAAPSITFTGDLDTGIYSPAANQIALTTSGQGRLFVNTSGFVGIGTASPGTALEVSGEIRNTSNLSNSNNPVFYSYSGASPGTVQAGLQLVGSDQHIRFYTAATERVRITSSGFVGIGTSSPAALLDVNAGTAGTHAIFSHVAGRGLEIATVAISSTSAAGIIYNVRGATLGTHIFQTDGNERLRITSTGAVNIVGAGTAGSTQAISFNGSAPVNSLVVDSSGRVLVGTSSGETASLGALFQVQSTSSVASALIKRNDNGVLPPYLYFGKSRGTAVNSTTPVQSGDTLGEIRFTGADGSTQIGSIAASVTAAVDNTPGSGDMPGRLVFATTANGAATPTERMRIDSAGQILHSFSGTAGTSVDALSIIGTPSYLASGSEARIVLSPHAAGRSVYMSCVNTSSTNMDLAFGTSAAASPIERMRLDSSGRLLVGTSGTRAIEPFENATAGTANEHLFEQTHTDGRTGIAIVANSDTTAAYGSFLYLARTRSSGVGANTIVSSGDNLGTIGFAGADGTDIRTKAAAIYAQVDGTPGANDMPGRIIFATTADGAAAPTERLYITSAGRVGVGTSSPSQTLDVNGTVNIKPATGYNVVFQQSATSLRLNYLNDAASANISAAYRATSFEWQNSGGTPVVNIDSSGRVLVGTSSNYTGAFLQLEGTTSSSATISTRINASGNLAATLQLEKSNGTAVGSNTIVTSGDVVGRILFRGNDGNSGITLAQIAGIVDNTPGSGSMPGRLVFGTTPSGATAPVDRMQISNSGTTTLTSAASTAPFIANIGASEVARIDSSGKLLVGTTTARSQQGVNTRLQVENTAYDGLALVVNSVDGQACPIILMGKSNGSALNSSTPVASGNRLGALYFQGADGTDIESSAAAIEVFVDGTPGANDMPGRLIFATTADGAAAPTERMRIDSAGKVTISGTVTGTVAQFTSLSGATIARSAPVTKTGNFTWSGGENWIICSGAATITGTLPTASSFSGRELMIKTVTAQSVISASSNVVALTGGAAGTAILANTIGKYATLVSDGTNWIIMQAN